MTVGLFLVHDLEATNIMQAINLRQSGLTISAGIGCDVGNSIGEVASTSARPEPVWLTHECDLGSLRNFFLFAGIGFRELA